MKKRVHYLVNKRLQFGLTFRFLFLTILFYLSILIFLFIGFEVYITIWPAVSGVISKDLMNLVRYQVFFGSLCFSLPVILVILGFSIVFTHRIAGPLSHLERTLDMLIQGEDVEYISLRKGDELQELITKVNKLIRMAKESKSPIKTDSPPLK